MQPQCVCEPGQKAKEETALGADGRRIQTNTRDNSKHSTSRHRRRGRRGIMGNGEKDGSGVGGGGRGTRGGGVDDDSVSGGDGGALGGGDGGGGSEGGSDVDGGADANGGECAGLYQESGAKLRGRAQDTRQ